MSQQGNQQVGPLARYYLTSGGRGPGLEEVLARAQVLDLRRVRDQVGAGGGVLVPIWPCHYCCFGTHTLTLQTLLLHQQHHRRGNRHANAAAAFRPTAPHTQVLASAKTIEQDLTSQFQLRALASAVPSGAFTVASEVDKAAAALADLASYSAVRPLWLQLKSAVCCEVSSMWLRHPDRSGVAAERPMPRPPLAWL
jgi:hypothetical protein